MAPKAVQLNEQQTSNSPIEFNDNNNDHDDVTPYDNDEDNSDHYDVLPDVGNDDNRDHYDVFPDDGHDDFVVPYAVVPFDITECEATSMYPSLQVKDTNLYDGLRKTSPMSRKSSYVLGRIAESGTSVGTRFAVGKKIDNTATSVTKF